MTTPRRLRLHAALATVLAIVILSACGSPEPIPSTTVPAAALFDSASTPAPEKATPKPTAEKSYATIALSQPTNTSDSTPATPTSVTVYRPTHTSTTTADKAGWNAFFDQQEQAIRQHDGVLHVRTEEIVTEDDVQMTRFTSDIWFDSTSDAGRIEIQASGESDIPPTTMVLSNGTMTWVTYDEYSKTDDGVEELSGCLGIDQPALDFLWCGSFIGIIGFAYGGGENELFFGPATALIESEFRGTPALVAEMYDPGFEDMDPVLWYVDRDSFLPLGMRVHWPSEPGEEDNWSETAFIYDTEPTAFDMDCLNPASLGVDVGHVDGDGASRDLDLVPISLGEAVTPVGNFPEFYVSRVIPGCDRPDEVDYDVLDEAYVAAWIVLHIWEPTEWDTFQLYDWSLLWQTECAESTRVDIAGGYAIITATWDEMTFSEWAMSESTECPTEPRNRFMARVFYEDLTVTINVPVPEVESRGQSYLRRSGPYQNVVDVMAVINQLQRTPAE